jgi:PKHD-type hydroxylase
MQYLLTPHALPIEPFVWWEGAFTEQELNWLQDKAKRAEQNATVGEDGVGVVNANVRRSQVSWLNNSPDTKWLFDKLADVVSKMNAQHFRFDLTGFGEELQLTNYNQAENGMYGWHQDYGGGISRKLSMAVQLTDPSEYEGGNLQVLTSSQPKNVRKQRGLIAIFPSYVLHQVTPVTQGSRQSLVAWVSGPAFK